jgi:hypothetical protein
MKTFHQTQPDALDFLRAPRIVTMPRAPRPFNFIHVLPTNFRQLIFTFPAQVTVVSQCHTKNPYVSRHNGADTFTPAESFICARRINLQNTLTSRAFANPRTTVDVKVLHRTRDFLEYYSNSLCPIFDIIVT